MIIGRMAIYIYPEWVPWIEIETTTAVVHWPPYKGEEIIETGRWVDYVHPISTG